jgi:hypothetical protein
VYEVHALIVRAHIAAGSDVVLLSDIRRQVTVDQQLAANTQVYFECARVEFDRGGGRRERVRRQGSHDDRRDTLDIAIALADADAREVADDEVYGFRITLGFEQVAKKRQHVVELPAREAIVRFEEARIVEILGMQFIAARNGTAESRRGAFSVRAGHVSTIVEARRVRAPFVIARTPSV